MKKLVLMSILIVIGGLAANAMAEDFEVKFSTGVLSQDLGYMGGVSMDAPVLESSLNVYLPKGFYVNIWNSEGLRNGDIIQGASDETDYTVGWAGKIRWFNVNLCVTYYDQLPQFDREVFDTVSPKLEVGLPLNLGKSHYIEPYTLMEPSFSVGETADRDDVGLYTTLGLKHKWQITPKVAVAHKANVMHYEIGNSLRDGWVAAYYFSLNLRVTKNLELHLPVVKANFPIEDNMFPDRGPEYAVGAGLTFRFGLP